jgi:hypothetical protein
METERPPLISEVVPVYEEAANLRAFLSSVTTELDKDWLPLRIDHRR